jgi:hypothetical protein
MLFSGYASAASENGNGVLKRLKEKAETIVTQYNNLSKNIEAEKTYREQWWPANSPNPSLHELRSQLTQELADIVQIMIDEKLLEKEDTLKGLKEVRQAIVELSQLEPR